MKKIQHILIHVLVWGAILLFLNTSNFSWQVFSVKDGTMLIPSLYGNFFNAFLVYFNAFFLYNLKNKSKIKYWFLAILTILVISFLEAGVDYLHTKNTGQLEATFEIIRNDLAGESLNFDLENGLPILAHIAYFMDDVLVHTLFWFLSFAYILPIEIVRNTNLKKQLEREKLEAEIKFLKAQINPHTLFNGINSIYHLIDRDKEKAKDVLVRFSELLRYQIYECSVDEILLSNELLFLENYFNLEKIRKGADVEIEYKYNISDVGNLKIAPLLLIPFVENAFKYVSNHDEKKHNYIKCEASVYDNKLRFNVENSIERLEKKEKSNSGIGLMNVKERLKLLYPKKYLLDIKNNKNVFSVNLILELYE